MGRGETYETDVNFERRERGVSAGGGNEPSWWRLVLLLLLLVVVVVAVVVVMVMVVVTMENSRGSRRRRLQTRDPGRYQPRANQTSTDHSQNIHLKSPRQCPPSPSSPPLPPLLPLAAMRDLIRRRDIAIATFDPSFVPCFITCVPPDQARNHINDAAVFDPRNRPNDQIVPEEFPTGILAR